MNVRDRHIYESLHDRMIYCRRCGSTMMVDDVDYNFMGNFNLYFSCKGCSTSCIQQTRYNRLVKEFWHTECERGKYSVIDEEIVTRVKYKERTNET